MKKKDLIRGFTMIELLLVIAAIGILAGVTLSVINTQHQKKVAEDTVKRSSLEKVAQGVEAYASIESGYPTGTGDTKLATYIASWPTGFTYVVDGTRSSFAAYVLKSVDETNYLKYSSSWGTIQECGPTDIATISTCSTPVVPGPEPEPGPGGDKQYVLTVSVSGPILVTSSPGAISCDGGLGFGGACVDSFDSGTSVTLTATVEKAEAVSWTGCVVAKDPYVCEVVLDSDKTVAVEEAPVPQ